MLRVFTVLLLLAELSLGSFSLVSGQGAEKRELEAFRFTEDGFVVAVMQRGVDPNAVYWHPKGREPIHAVPVSFDQRTRLIVYKIPVRERELFPPLLRLEKSSRGVLRDDELSCNSQMCRHVQYARMYRGKYLPIKMLSIRYEQQHLAEGLPVLNRAGKVVGVTQLRSGKQSLQAIPVEVLHKLMGLFRARKKNQRAWLGVTMDRLNEVAIVEAVRPGYAADKAGLQSGDILLQIGARRVGHYHDALDAEFYLLAGEKVVVKYLRGTQVRQAELEATLHPLVRLQGW